MKVLVLLLLLLPGIALAHTFTFTWTDPSTRMDGSALNPTTELKSYRMQCSGPENVERVVNRAETSVVGDRRMYEWTNAVQISGMYDCRMTATDTGDLESLWSNTTSVPKFAAPSAPTDLRGQ